MVLDCKSLAAEIKAKVKDEVSNLSVTPILFIFQVGDNPASNAYIKGKVKDCEECGIKCAVMKSPESISESELIAKVLDVTDRCEPCSVILQLPVPKHISADNVVNVLNRKMDVDGLNVWNNRMFGGNSVMRPCTPLGVMELLHRYNIPIAGKHCVVIGRSKIVGKPLYGMMLEEDATTTICHSKTENLAEITRTADILVSAVGKPNLITADMVKEDCTVIDVGINRVKSKLCGDVDFPEVSKKVKYITTVPGGIGLLTRAMLMQNVIKSHKLQAKD